MVVVVLPDGSWLSRLLLLLGCLGVHWWDLHKEHVRVLLIGFQQQQKWCANVCECMWGVGWAGGGRRIRRWHCD